MPVLDVAASMSRVEGVLRQRPAAGRHEDMPACVRWEGGLRTVARHEGGAEIVSEMPRELGGAGGLPTPGWYLRAALASCTATRIAMSAAAEGISLSALEVTASSRSDLRGLMGMADADGVPVPAAPEDVQLRVRIAAPGTAADRLVALVQAANACAPVTAALQCAVPVTLTVDVEPA